jgi:hypothetical protein
LDGKTFAWYNTFGRLYKFVSFADSDAPPGEPAGSDTNNWMRTTYDAASDAMPIKMSAVKGKKNVYKLYNDWKDSQYSHWLIMTAESGGSYQFMSSGGKTEADAVEIEFISTGTDDMTYIMKHTATGKYISFCTSGCSSGYWIAGEYAKTDAMTIRLTPPGNTPSAGGWGYCTSKDGVPEQVGTRHPHSSHLQLPSTHLQPSLATAAASPRSISSPPSPTLHAHPALLPLLHFRLTYRLQVRPPSSSTL